MTYTIDEGGKGVLRKVEFIGNEVFSARELRKQMTQKQKGLFKTTLINSDTDDLVPVFFKIFDNP